MLDFDLLRRTAETFFVNEYPQARIRELDEARELPVDLWQRLGALGWLGLNVPTRFGGAGAGSVAAAVLVEEISRRFASLAVDYVLAGMTSRLLVDHGTSDQQAVWLPGTADGSLLMAFGISEPGGGTDALALTSRARQEGNEWVVEGQKLWTSMAYRSDFVIAVVRTDPPDPPDRRARGISLIAVPTRQPSVTVNRVHLAGMRSAGTCQVFFDGARAPATNLIGERGRGFYHMLGTLNIERVLAGALSLGIARGALEDAIAYANVRSAFGRPIGGFQAIQHPLAESAAELEAARLLVHKAASALDRGEQPTLEAAMSKVFAAEVAARATDRGMRVLGAHGLAIESDMQRHFRDARLQTFSPISNEMAKNVIGEMLGMPRSY